MMRNFGRFAVAVVALLAGVAAYALVLSLVVEPAQLPAPASLVAQGIGSGLLMVGAVGGPVRALTYDTLRSLGNPQLGNEPQAIRHILFDTDTVTSTVTTSITFFTTARGNKTLTNLATPGQLNAGEFFEIGALGFDIRGTTSEVAGAGGILADIQEIMLGQAPVFTLIYNSKNYGPYPLSFLHTSGGAVGSLSTGTQDTVQLGNNGVTDGGWNWGGGLILCPSVGFSVTVDFAAAPTITQGPLKVRFWMEGILSRNVV